MAPIDEKLKAEILKSRITGMNDKVPPPLSKLSGKLQTIPTKPHRPINPENEIKDEAGIFDTMVDELPQGEGDDDAKTKKHPGHDKVKTYLKRKRKAKQARKDKKKQRNNRN